jgi:hypothetical protein
VVRQALVNLKYQPYIDAAPMAPKELYAQASANDAVTIQAWRHYWVRQYKANHEKFGPFKDRAITKLYNRDRNKPVIIVGSGPSLKHNAKVLLDNPGLTVISCLHNFHFLEDLGVKVDFYVTLDAGPLTVDEVSEGGNPDVNYWEKTKGKTLLAYAGSYPELLEKWQGEILFFNAPVPDEGLMKELEGIERFNAHVSNGGNVLGACLYIAKGYLGSQSTIFMGADFSFSYEEKFHGWDSKYDQSLGHSITLTDVFGIPVQTWPSYRNFKSFFEYVAQQVPGEYINCSEGGCFGSYPGGNIRAVKQMTLEDYFKTVRISDHLANVANDPSTAEFKILY